MAQEVRTVDQPVSQTVESGQPSAPRAMFLPPADIYETHDNLVMLAEAPGVPLDAIDITLDRRY
jgi:HSP20 family molecular chaperone IbpA